MAAALLPPASLVSLIEIYLRDHLSERSQRIIVTCIYILMKYILKFNYAWVKINLGNL